MRARTSHRIASTALAALFLCALAGDAFATHPCPHHQGAVAGSASDHDASHGSHHGTDDGSHGPCTCVGRCHAGAAPPLPVPLLLGALPIPGTPPASIRTTISDRPAVAPFSLPWPNAPPTL